MSGDARNGIILIAVLWAVALVATLALAASVTFRGFAGVVGVASERLRAEALLTAGLEVAGGLVATSGDIPLADVESTVTMAPGSVRLRLDDEGGRIDIGQAPVELLTAMFRGIGVQDPDAISKAVVDWRQDGAAPTSAVGNAAAGNTTAGPAAARAPKAPTAPPFTDVHQLMEVPGMRPEWVAAAAPLTTVFGNATVNPLTAPAAVIAVLPGIDPARLAAFLDTRRAYPGDASRLAAALPGAQPWLAAKPPQAVAVDLSARLADGYVADADAVIVSLKNDPQPYRVLRWQPKPPQPRP